jgi:hypothetical protein
MAKNPPDERLVYLALKNIFKGEGSQVRNPKKIRKQIEKHLDEGEIRTLIAEHNIDNICNTARKLLEDEIFTSTLKAKIRFPEVFEVSPAQSAERSTSEAEAARSEVDAFKDAAEGHQETWLSVRVDELDLARKGKTKELGTIVQLFYRTLLIKIRCGDIEGTD